jgi:ketosteroid isomerase-like protein
MADAHEQIRNLLGTYCERMDAGDFAGLAELFADARLTDEHGTVFATGRDEVLAMWQVQTQLHDGSPRTRHVTANTVIHVGEDGSAATATSSYVVFQRVDGFPLQPIVTGRYADTFARDGDGNWHWAERRYAIDHAGDLSHHLRLS